MHDFVTNLVTSRIGYAFNTRTFLDTLLQYNTDLKQFSANVRFDLIHRPLSDLFLVYNEQQLTESAHAHQRGTRADSEIHAHACILRIGESANWRIGDCSHSPTRQFSQFTNCGYRPCPYPSRYPCSNAARNSRL